MVAGLGVGTLRHRPPATASLCAERGRGAARPPAGGRAPGQTSALVLGAGLALAPIRQGRRGRGRRGGHGLRPVVGRRAAVSTAWEPGQQDLRTFGSADEYQAHLLREGALPRGFRVGRAQLSFSPVESQMVTDAQMNLTIVALDEPTDHYALVFTSNAFPGCPVVVGRRRLAERKPLQAIVVNNKVSNVCPGGDGEAASEALCEAVADALGLAGGAGAVLPCSTGVIGWRLPVEEMKAAVPTAVQNLQAESAVPGAEGICTTDRFPKVASHELPGGARIVAFAKGAGMIEPNMATMLGYVLTDADLPCGPQELQEMLRRVAAASFNAVSVDGDESTSDTVALLCSRRVECGDVAAFEASLLEVCRDLAQQLVRNGEGTQHVMRISVTGASSDASALRVGRAVANGPLFKCAVAGNDPNVGRLVGKVGQQLGAMGEREAVEGAVFRIAGQTIFADGRFSIDEAQEAELSRHLKEAEMDAELTYPPHFRVVDVEVQLGAADGSAVMLGSDLTNGYVNCNADYRS